MSAQASIGAERLRRVRDALPPISNGGRALDGRAALNFWPGHERRMHGSWRTTMPANSATAAGRLPRFRGSMRVSASFISARSVSKALFPGLRTGYARHPACAAAAVRSRPLFDGPAAIDLEPGRGCRLHARRALRRAYSSHALLYRDSATSWLPRSQAHHSAPI